jgi:hypothetical protein
VQALDLDTVFEVDEPRKSPLVREAGARWNLPEDDFIRWWRCLPEEDRAEFVGVYGGDETLARFVCALDYLTVMQARPQSGQTIVEAYAIAVNTDVHSEAARSGATACWKHDAVQALIDRLRYRSARQAAARITNKATFVIESMLKDAENEDVQTKATAVRTALSFMKMVSDEDIQERAERTKRGFVAARKELSDGDVEVPTPERAALYLKQLRELLGPDKFKEATAALNG